MKTLNIYILAAIGLCWMGCQKVIDVDLDTAAPRLVIDASIDWVKNTDGKEQKIKLTTTTGYYNNTFPAVTGADVVVTNSAGTVFRFAGNSPTGEYICQDFRPVIGETYTLKIVLNGETYTASETLMPVPDIEDRIDQDSTGGMAGDEMEITYYYRDDPARENYYLYSNKIPQVAFPQYQVENDANSQGNRVTVYYSHKDLKAGDLVDIKLYGISKRYYDYFRKIVTASGNDDNPFATTPNAVRGNLVNQTNDAHFAYGYFRLCEVVARSYRVQ